MYRISNDFLWVKYVFGPSNFSEFWNQSFFKTLY